MILVRRILKIRKSHRFVFFSINLAVFFSFVFRPEEPLSSRPSLGVGSPSIFSRMDFVLFLTGSREIKRIISR